MTLDPLPGLQLHVTIAQNESELRPGDLPSEVERLYFAFSLPFVQVHKTDMRAAVRSAVWESGPRPASGQRVWSSVSSYRSPDPRGLSSRVCEVGTIVPLHGAVVGSWSRLWRGPPVTHVAPGQSRGVWPPWWSTVWVDIVLTVPAILDEQAALGAGGRAERGGPGGGKVTVQLGGRGPEASRGSCSLGRRGQAGVRPGGRRRAHWR